MKRRRLGNKPLEADIERARVWFNAPGSGSPPAPNDAQYLVLAVNTDLVNERVFTAGDGIDVADAGAGGTFTVSVDVTDIIDPDYGLTEDSNNIRLNIGDGLEFDTGALEVDLVDAWSGLEFDSGDLRVDQDAAFTWTAVHTHAANLILDDGSLDSPQLQFVGGSHDDTAYIYLEDAPDAEGGSSLIVKLCDDGGESGLEIRDSSGNRAAYILSDGKALFEGRVRATAGGIRTQPVYGAVSDPPTDAELDALFGSALSVGDGFIGIVMSE